MSLTAEYQKFLSQAARGALCGLIADHPTMRVVDLREILAEHPALGSLTLTDLLGQSGGSRQPKAKPQRTKANVRTPAAAKKAGAQGKWNTHTDEGRAALDRAVLEALAVFGGVGVSAEALRARLGATPAQLRASLNRHIEAGDVSFSGKARGTRYSLE